MRSSNANIATIEDYAQWILDECRDCRKRKKRIRLERISFWGKQIDQFAQQDMRLRSMRNPGRAGE